MWRVESPCQSVDRQPQHIRVLRVAHLGELVVTVSRCAGVHDLNSAAVGAARGGQRSAVHQDDRRRRRGAGGRSGRRGRRRRCGRRRGGPRVGVGVRVGHRPDRHEEALADARHQNPPERQDYAEAASVSRRVSTHPRAGRIHSKTHTIVFGNAIPFLGKKWKGRRAYFGNFSKKTYVQPRQWTAFAETFRMIWLNIGLSCKIIKIRTTRLFFMINLCSATPMASSRRDLSNDRDEHRLILKNNQYSYHPSSGFAPLTGRAFPKRRFCFYCVFCE